MSFKRYILIFLISTIFASETDLLTLSNYYTVSLSNLTGVFDIDFDNKLVNGELTYNFTCLSGDSQIILDTKNLKIESVTKIDKDGLEQKVEFDYGEEDENLGKPLIIEYGDFSEGDNISIKIKYSTTEDGNSAQFLRKEQTIGENSPFFFTISKMILGRQLLPSQDTPAQKFPFYLGIKVPNKFHGMISGLLDNIKEDGETKTFYYKQEHPVPNYLISLAAGNITEKNISDNISVYCEPEFIDTAVEVLDDFVDYYKATIDYLGEHVWGKFNILVLPNSFPYSAIENPYLSYVSQCLFDKDKSSVDLILKQLIHDWAGNLVTNDNWSDYWISVGIATFIKRKILGFLKGVDYAKSDATIGLVYIHGWSKYYENSSFSSLKPDYTGVNPDDYISDIPSEKGYNLMYYIESLIGENNMQKFLNKFFNENQFKSVNLNDFKDILRGFCEENDLIEKYSLIEWFDWIYKGGECPVDNKLANNIYQEEINIALDKFYEENDDSNEELIYNISNWNHLSKINFLTTLERKEEFLSDKQHDILTKKLKFYEKQNFAVSSNFFRMILSVTDKFYEHELESIKTFLSTYGNFEYLSGIYENFYKRDEVESIKLFESLKTFYHPIFIYNVQSEIDHQKENFPILTIELKDKDKCLFLDDLQNKDKLDLIALEFDNYTNFTSYEIPEGICLEIEEDKIKVNCILNTEEKYCLLDNGKSIEKSGEYKLNIPNRIQKWDYAIKVHDSKTKIYTKKTEIDEEKTKKSYEIDFANNTKQNIEIYFVTEPDDKISILKEDKNIKCIKNNLTLQCDIDENIFNFDINNPKEFKTYGLKIVDLCGDEKYAFEVKVKNSKDKEEESDDSGGLKTWVIILIVIGCVFVLVIIIFFILRACKKKKNENFNNLKDNIDNQLLNDL